MNSRVVGLDKKAGFAENTRGFDDVEEGIHEEFGMGVDRDILLYPGM